MNNIELLPIEIRCTIEPHESCDKPIRLKSEGVDFDLVLTKLKRISETSHPECVISLDVLKIDTANVRSSYSIKTIPDLIIFLENLKKYAESKNQEVLKSLSEYIATFEFYRHIIKADEVIERLEHSVVVSYHRYEKRKIDRTLPPPVEIATNWLVVVDQKRN